MFVSLDFFLIGYVSTRLIWHIFKNPNKLAESFKKFRVVNTHLLNYLLMIHIKKEEFETKPITSEFINVKDS